MRIHRTTALEAVEPFASVKAPRSGLYFEFKTIGQLTELDESVAQPQNGTSFWSFFVSTFCASFVRNVENCSASTVFQALRNHSRFKSQVLRLQTLTPCRCGLLVDTPTLWMGFLNFKARDWLDLE